jgi:hypothetical protein
MSNRKILLQFSSLLYLSDNVMTMSQLRKLHNMKRHMKIRRIGLPYKVQDVPSGIRNTIGNNYIRISGSLNPALKYLPCIILKCQFRGACPDTLGQF